MFSEISSHTPLRGRGPLGGGPSQGGPLRTQRGTKDFYDSFSICRAAVAGIILWEYQIIKNEIEDKEIAETIG